MNAAITPSYDVRQIVESYARGHDEAPEQSALFLIVAGYSTLSKKVPEGFEKIFADLGYSTPSTEEPRG